MEWIVLLLHGLSVCLRLRMKMINMTTMMLMMTTRLSKMVLLTHFRVYFLLLMFFSLQILYKIHCESEWFACSRPTKFRTKFTRLAIGNRSCVSIVSQIFLAASMVNPVKFSLKYSPYGTTTHSNNQIVHNYIRWNFIFDMSLLYFYWQINDDDDECWRAICLRYII